MQEIISWYMEHKTYGNILIIGIIGLMLYNIDMEQVPIFTEFLVNW